VTLVAASPSGRAARRGIAQNRDGSASGVCLQSNSEGANANSMWQDVKPCDEGALGPTRPLPATPQLGEVSGRRSSALSLAGRDREFRH
jgi:hypothetical protein